MGRSATDPRLVQARLNEQRAIKLRLAGKSYAAIGRIMGCSESGAWRMVNRVMEESNAEAKEDALAYREIMNRRLEEMHAGVWRMAKSGDTDAIKAVLAIMDRQAKLYGMDAAVRHEIEAHVETSDGGDAALRKLAGLLDRAEAASRAAAEPASEDGDA